MFDREGAHDYLDHVKPRMHLLVSDDAEIDREFCPKCDDHICIPGDIEVETAVEFIDREVQTFYGKHPQKQDM